MSKRNVLTSLAMLLVASIVIMACGPTSPPAEPTQVQAQPTEVPAQPTQAQQPTEAAPAPTTVAMEVATPMPTAVPTPETGPVYGGTLLVTYQEDLQSLDTPSAWTTMDWGTAGQLLFEGLYVFDKDMNLVPNLAADMPTVSEDGLTYTIPVKQGVKFHNGRELTAQDLKYSMERNAKPNSGTWATVPMENIVGGQAVIDGTAEEAEGIKVVDDYTLEFQLLNPDAYFLHTLTMVTNYAVAKEEVEKWGDDFRFHPVGTGPFKLVEWVPGQRIVFERNPEYHKEGLPYLDKVVYELGGEPGVSLLRFEKGEVDVLADGLPAGDIERISTDPKWKDYFINAPTFLWQALHFQLNTPPFDNPKVRQAIAMGINKDKLVQLAGGLATKTNRLYPDIFPCHETDEEFGDPYPYDPEKAKQLLAEAGFPDGLEVKDVGLTGGYPWVSRSGESIQQDLAAIGIKAEPAQGESIVLDEMVAKGEMPFWFGYWGASFPDPYNHVTEMFDSQGIGAGNQTNYSNPKVDELVAKAKQTTDPEARCAVWKEIETILFQQDLPAVPLFHIRWPAMRSPRVEGFVWHPLYKRPWYEYLWIPKDQQ